MLSLFTCPKVSKPTKAFWFLKSSDKKWNKSNAFIYHGMRGMPMECSTEIEVLRSLHGHPPEDLEWGFTLSTFGYYRNKIKNVFNKI